MALRSRFYTSERTETEEDIRKPLGVHLNDLGSQPEKESDFCC